MQHYLTHTQLCYTSHRSYLVSPTYLRDSTCGTTYAVSVLSPLSSPHNTRTPLVIFRSSFASQITSFHRLCTSVSTRYAIPRVDLQQLQLALHDERARCSVAQQVYAAFAHLRIFPAATWRESVALRPRRRGHTHSATRRVPQSSLHLTNTGESRSGVTTEREDVRLISNAR